MDVFNVFSAWLSGSFRCEPTSAMDFYRDVFPKGELDARGSFTKGKYCGICVKVFDRKAKRYTVTDDLSSIEHVIQSDDFCIMSPVSYAGKTQTQTMARYLYALAFDLDDIIIRDDGTPQGLIDLFHQAECSLFPMPTYTVCSGSGLHLYYLLDNPLPLYPNILRQLDRLRHDLDSRIWNQYVTGSYENVQYESATQGFRMVGSITKDGLHRVSAYRTGERVTISTLNEFVKPENRIDITSSGAKMSLDQAKKKWPDWYQTRIVNRVPRGQSVWIVKRDLYDWWLRTIRESATVGHRYFCILALAVYAQKCAISEDELTSDALSLVSLFDSMSTSEQNRFDESDVMKALEIYHKPRHRFTRDKISELSGIAMEANKRNGRKRDVHMRIMRATRDILYPDGSWRSVSGAPTKKDLVQSYAREHPDANHSEIARELGVSRPTVIKWLRHDS